MNVGIDGIASKELSAQISQIHENLRVRSGKKGQKDPFWR